MANQAIQVEGLSKAYRIGMAAEKKDTLAGAAMYWMKAPIRNFRNLRSLDTAGFDGEADDILWALRDVSFEMKHGEALGIIGRNGAGKSTLLKVLSRITLPTRGRVTVDGRVASLLEVGTGFHPELTGRENVYMNGTILGMSKREIDGKFEAIVEFSGVRRFIDTPIKRYSSGMKVRLAFSVAAHLEPEVLIIDEVLAVGDTEFQRKCLGKMDEVASEGRTVVFVSHYLPAITRLCPRVLLLDEGRMVIDGPAHKVVQSYLGSGLGSTARREWNDPARAPGNEVVRMRAIRVLDHHGKVSESIDIRHPVTVELDWEALQPGHVLVPYIGFHNEDGIWLVESGDRDPEWYQRPRPAGVYTTAVTVPGNFWAEGTIFVSANIQTENPFKLHCKEADIAAFQVIDTIEGDSVRGEYGGEMKGIVRPMLEWSTRYEAGRSVSQVAGSGGRA